MRKRSAYESILDMMKDRLNQLGPISTDDAWKICRFRNENWAYGTILSIFRAIMLNLVFEERAIKDETSKRGGRYIITKLKN